MSEEDSGAQVIITDKSPILYPLVLVPVLGACASCYCPADGAGCIDCAVPLCSTCSGEHPCLAEPPPVKVADSVYGDSVWMASPREMPSGAEHSSSGTGGSEDIVVGLYSRLNSAWNSDGCPQMLFRNAWTSVTTDFFLSSCYIYDEQGCYRAFGSEVSDFHTLSFDLWPLELPLGFILFWLD